MPANGFVACSDYNLGCVSYVPNVQAFGHFYTGQPGRKTHPKISDIGDGTSNTVAFVERYGVAPTPPNGANGRTAWLGVIPGVLYNPYYASNENGATPTISPPQDAIDPMRADPSRAQSAHPGGMNVLLMDSSVRTVSARISSLTWKYAILPNDGKSLGNDW
jgi:hypothetical protein